MQTQAHYLLICDSSISTPAIIDGQCQPTVGIGRWSIVLERIDGPDRLEAQDCESYIHQDRLALLAVVRGLEALEQSSRVRLVTNSRYVDRGMRFGLPNWRETEYQWESFGVRKPVRNADLWRRVDVAFRYHEIACRLLKSSLADSDAMDESITVLPAIPDVAACELAIASARASDQRMDSGSSTIPAPHFRPAKTAPAKRAAANAWTPRHQWW